jgi:hypothetical protein
VWQHWHLAMADDDEPRAEIARLEEQIEALVGTIEGCRKIIQFSKLAMAAGALWWLALVVGAVSFDPAWMIGTLVAIIGGIVAFGSNATTLQQALAERTDAEAERAELIDRIDPQVVGERDGRPSSVVAFPTRR